MNNTKYEGYYENRQHTTAIFPYNTYLCTIPQDFKNVPLHWHDEAEIIYIKKGSGIISVNLKNYIVTGGDIVFVLPGHLHSISAIEGCRMEYENIIFEMDFLSSKLPEKMYLEYFTPLCSGELDFPILISPESCQKYADAAHFLDMADACCRDKAPAYEIAVKGYLFCFFSCLFSNCSPKKTEGKNNPNLDKIKLVIKYVEDHYSEPISIDDMANLCCFSSSHFMRFFKEIMNTTFVKYLNEYRLTKAAESLLSTHTTILEISQNTGFENLSLFNRQFRKKYNTTPSTYRKNMGGNPK